MNASSAVEHSLATLSGLTDSVPLDALGDLSAPDLSDVADDIANVLGEASGAIADTAAVLGRSGSRLAGRSARGAWRNREAVATVAVVAIVALAIIGFVKRRSADTESDV